LLEKGFVWIDHAFTLYLTPQSNIDNRIHL